MTDLGPYTRSSQDSPEIPFLGHLKWLTIPAEVTGGLLGVNDSGLVPAGFSPPLHRHEREHELFIVVGGEVLFSSGDVRTVVADSGAAFLPAGLEHSFRVLSEARMFEVTIASGTAPAGDFQRFISDVGAATTPDVPQPDLFAMLAELGEQHHIPILGPPLT